VAALPRAPGPPAAKGNRRAAKGQSSRRRERAERPGRERAFTGFSIRLPVELCRQIVRCELPPASRGYNVGALDEQGLTDAADSART
jgi:hypothetical protein